MKQTQAQQLTSKPKKAVDKHTTECFICWEMESRAYEDEAKFWDDWFKQKEKSIKFILTYRGEVVERPVKAFQ